MSEKFWMYLVLYLSVGLVIGIWKANINIEDTERNKYLMDFLEDYPGALALAQLIVVIAAMFFYPYFIVRHIVKQIHSK